jgi:hypothetical protein
VVLENHVPVGICSIIHLIKENFFLLQGHEMEKIKTLLMTTRSLPLKIRSSPMTTAYMICQKVFIFNLDTGKKKSTIMNKAYR